MTLLLAVLALGCAPALVSWAAAVLLPPRGEGERSAAVAGAVWLAGYAASLPVVLWALARAGRPAGALLAGFAPARLGTTLTVGLGLAAVLCLLALAARRGGTMVLAWAYRVSGRAPLSAAANVSPRRYPALIALLIAVAAAAYEELIWRGLLQAGLAAPLGRPAAVAVAALAFAAMHLRQGAVAAAFSAAAAGVLGAAFAWRGDLAAVLVAHAAYNAAAVAVDRRGSSAARRAATRTGGARLSVSIPG